MIITVKKFLTTLGATWMHRIQILNKNFNFQAPNSISKHQISNKFQIKKIKRR